MAPHHNRGDRSCQPAGVAKPGFGVADIATGAETRMLAASMADCNPVMVEVIRGALVESVHRGAAAVLAPDGGVVAAWGDIDRPVFARSAAKPLQALPLLETGAADHFRLGDEEVALACASHGGEPLHVTRVGEWLARLGLGHRDLACGPHAPLSEAAARDLIESGHEPSPLHNNCSGKHAGFLTTALFLRESTRGYAGPVHPVQLRVKRVVAQMGGIELAAEHVAVDGCGVPVFAMPVRALAQAMARLADPSGLGRLRAGAVRRVVRAMTAHPELVAGSGRFDTVAIEAAEGALIAKSGAEGVLVAALIERGLGIALKIDDGAKRSAEAAMAALLIRFGALGRRAEQAIAAFQDMPVRNTTGARVGSVRVAAGWPG